MTETELTEAGSVDKQTGVFTHLLRGLVFGAALGLLLFLIYIAAAAFGW